MLFGTSGKNQPEMPLTYCYCNYGESGVMVNCENCKGWFHDTCIGMKETEIFNIDKFYCGECTYFNKNLITLYKADTASNSNNDGIYCHCRDVEYGTMTQCCKCKDWIHEHCSEYSRTDFERIILYFCKNCIA